MIFETIESHLFLSLIKMCFFFFVQVVTFRLYIYDIFLFHQQTWMTVRALCRTRLLNKPHNYRYNHCHYHLLTILFSLLSKQKSGFDWIWKVNYINKPETIHMVDIMLAGHKV